MVATSFSVLDANIRSSAEAATEFVDWYYPALNSGKSVVSGYINNNVRYKEAGHAPADICVNGIVVPTPDEWDSMLEKQRYTAITSKNTVHYIVESYDVHVINPDYRFAAPADLLPPTSGLESQRARENKRLEGVRIVMMLTVSGTVHFGTDAKDPVLKQHFNDVFILVPNWDVLSRAGSRATRRYLISSHTYRAY
ncbi:hypothetical protein B0H63DRAFT_247019 [Podospora didyma]|uniref:NTF2 domain-containing protein n=1 Tax=Podospora didyma TaxID=330526 RepID=A0AAE0KLP9_9PEZI|nr:hypothetical protein B0H63DRAFT_247019 [Podospora didyma]